MVELRKNSLLCTRGKFEKIHGKDNRTCGHSSTTKKKCNCVLFARCCGSSKHEIIQPTYHVVYVTLFFWFLFSQLLVDATSSNQPNYRGNKFLQGYQLKSLSKILFNRVSNTIDLITDQISPVV